MQQAVNGSKEAALAFAASIQDSANPKFVEDVRRRKLCIAEGQGTVRGITYDLEAQFGLGLRRAAAT